MDRHMEGSRHTLRQAVHTYCAAVSISSGPNLCRIAVVISRGKSCHGGVASTALEDDAIQVQFNF